MKGVMMSLCLRVALPLRARIALRVVAGWLRCAEGFEETDHRVHPTPHVRVTEFLEKADGAGRLFHEACARRIHTAGDAIK